MAKDTRNWLTHYDPDMEKKAASGSELLLLTESVTALLEACILRDLGLNEDERMERLLNTPRVGILRNN